ncbi:phosphoribosyltransferase [soil metagenome]
MPNQRRLKDRTQAGELLAARLSGYAGRSDVVVLALPRGGVAVGYAIARALETSFDIVLLHKANVRQHRQPAMQTLARGNPGIARRNAINAPANSLTTGGDSALAEELESQLCEALRDERPALPLTDRIVILVDDGLASSATMQLAVQLVRKAGPARLIIATPVAAAEARTKLQAEVNELICLSTPEPFHTVGMWYENFQRTSDAEVRELLEKAWRREDELVHAHVLIRSGLSGSNGIRC